MMKYAEDFVVGEKTALGDCTITADEIISFARKYDPQPYHLSAEDAEGSEFGGLVASGWNTACLWMKLYVEVGLKDAAAAGSPGVDEMRWFAPVAPDTILTGSVEVLKHVANPFERNIVTIRKKGLLVAKTDETPVFSLIIHSRLKKRPN
jgi:acyl dehydratase